MNLKCGHSCIKTNRQLRTTDQKPWDYLENQSITMENCETNLKIRENQPKPLNSMKLSWKLMKTNRKAWNPVKLPWKPTENYDKKWNTREGLFFVTHTQKALIFCDLWKGSVLCASAWNIDHQHQSPWWQPGVELWWQRGGCKGYRGRQDSSQEEHTKPPRHWIINCKCVCIHVFVIYWCIKSLLVPILHFCQSSEV